MSEERFKLMTTHDCLRLKRELDVNEDEDEDIRLRSMFFALIVVFVFFIIGLGIWLISSSCIMKKTPRKRRKNKQRKRKPGGEEIDQTGRCGRTHLFGYRPYSYPRYKAGASNKTFGNLNIPSKLWKTYQIGVPLQNLNLPAIKSKTNNEISPSEETQSQESSLTSLILNNENTKKPGHGIQWANWLKRNHNN
ncbi:uncharacterized protein Dwil_GK27964 [Drosophila willistoni]|uniref:Uncharacterized protein n=1 Tax=Drosophila willistoni TaxID=7260 RepID=A0A0Q9WT47_DROWI|nr:uncharacterized protein LOC26529966 [Drosophila willistoni]KRF99292.1 uncharacterized protein Dwil_GK27964 [Drosophila willistoni]